MFLIEAFIFIPMVALCMVSVLNAICEYEADSDDDSENEALVRQRPKVVYSSKSMPIESEDDKQCSICLSEYEDGEMVVFLDCLHFFHADCVHQWITLNHSCPICRYKC